MNYADKDPPTKRSWPNFPPPSHVLDFIKQGYEQTRPVTTLLKLKFRAFIFVQDVKFMKIKGSKDSKEGTKIPLHRASSALKTKKPVSDSHYNHRLALTTYLPRRWILDSTKISLNLASWSFLVLSRCLRMDTAFLMRKYMSSGRSGARALDFRILRILLPVMKRTCHI